MAGLLFDVLTTMRLVRLNPYSWVLDYLRACARNRGLPPDRLNPSLPWLMDEDRKRELRRPSAGWRGTSQNPSVATDEECFSVLPLAA